MKFKDLFIKSIKLLLTRAIKDNLIEIRLIIAFINEGYGIKLNIFDFHRIYFGES